MSLKFGIYLVEQRIISPEQFCGLVKIQQEAGASIATVAIRKNMLTIKQVARILDQQELSPSQSFIEIAIASDCLDRADADQLVQEQRNSSPTIQRLVQECGLLTERQCNVLFQHFQRNGTRPMQQPSPAEAIETEQPTPASTPYQSTPTTNPARPRAPKFKQRPVIVSPYTSPSQ